MNLVPGCGRGQGTREAAEKVAGGRTLNLQGPDGDSPGGRGVEGIRLGQEGDLPTKPKGHKGARGPAIRTLYCHLRGRGERDKGPQSCLGLFLSQVGLFVMRWSWRKGRKSRSRSREDDRDRPHGLLMTGHLISIGLLSLCL